MNGVNEIISEGAIVIGHVKRDLSAAERQHAERYALDNADGVRLLLADYHALVQRQYAGDYDAVIILADLQRAIDMAALTWRQKSALHYVFIEQWTQKDSANVLGVPEQTLSDRIQAALTRIADIYESWAWQGEGYVVYQTEKGANI
jgi:DNA-directed RNA polymerase specialized sigma24 family protein